MASEIAESQVVEIPKTHEGLVSFMSTTGSGELGKKRQELIASDSSDLKDTERILCAAMASPEAANQQALLKPEVVEASHLYLSLLGAQKSSAEGDEATQSTIRKGAGKILAKLQALVSVFS